MAGDIEAIRVRWAGARWHYGQNSLSPTYVGDAWIYQDPATVDDESTLLLDLDEPTPTDIAFLQLAAQAPADIAALFERIDSLVEQMERINRIDAMLRRVSVAARAYRQAIHTLDAAGAEAALFAALDAVGDAP